MKIKRYINSGFTIVELMVVIVVIAMLASIVVVGYGKWQESIAKKAVQSDLKMAASAMEDKKNFSEGYPSSLPTTFKQSESSEVSYAWGNLQRYCLNGVSSRVSSVAYHIDSTQDKSVVREGICGANPSNPPGVPRFYAGYPMAYREAAMGLFVYWNEPASPGGSAITKYKVRVVFSGECAGPDEVYEVNSIAVGASAGGLSRNSTGYQLTTGQPIGECDAVDTPGLVSKVYVAAKNSDGYGPELELSVSDDWM